MFLMHLQPRMLAYQWIRDRLGRTTNTSLLDNSFEEDSGYRAEYDVTLHDLRDKFL